MLLIDNNSKLNWARGFVKVVFFLESNVIKHPLTTVAFLALLKTKGMFGNTKEC